MDAARSLETSLSPQKKGLGMWRPKRLFDNTKAAGSFEASVSFYETERCQILKTIKQSQSIPAKKFWKLTLRVCILVDLTGAQTTQSKTDVWVAKLNSYTTGASKSNGHPWRKSRTLDKIKIIYLIPFLFLLTHSLTHSLWLLKP